MIHRNRHYDSIFQIFCRNRLAHFARSISSYFQSDRGKVYTKDPSEFRSLMAVMPKFYNYNL